MNAKSVLLFLLSLMHFLPAYGQYWQYTGRPGNQTGELVSTGDQLFALGVFSYRYNKDSNAWEALSIPNINGVCKFKGEGYMYL